jgi:hypothetical protein
MNIVEADHFAKVIDKVLGHFAGSDFKSEVALAKKEFFESLGVLDENSPFYESRMNQFFDWYFFDRNLVGYGRKVIDSLHMSRELRFDDHELAIVEKLKSYVHGMFEFIKIKDSDVSIRDLFTGKKYVVKKCPWVYGFNPDEYFEARLIPEGDSFVFSRGFCFHPKEAKKFILNEIKKHKKNPDLDPNELMLSLSKMRGRLDRYPHVDVDKIYLHSLGEAHA